MPKVLSFDNKSEKRLFLFVLYSFIRTFAPDFNERGARFGRAEMIPMNLMQVMLP